MHVSFFRTRRKASFNYILIELACKTETKLKRGQSGDEAKSIAHSL